MKAAVIGAFDPFTRGHAWLIEQGRRIFEEIHVIVVDDPVKKTLFSMDERSVMTHDWVLKSGLMGVYTVQREVQSVSKYLGEQKIMVVLRTLKNSAEYANARRKINDKPIAEQTLYFIAPQEFESCVSASVRGMLGNSGWEKLVRRYVPEIICDGPYFDRFQKKLLT